MQNVTTTTVYFFQHQQQRRQRRRCYLRLVGLATSHNAILPRLTRSNRHRHFAAVGRSFRPNSPNSQCHCCPQSPHVVIISSAEQFGTLPLSTFVCVGTQLNERRCCRQMGVARAGSGTVWGGMPYRHFLGRLKTTPPLLFRKIRYRYTPRPIMQITTCT